MCFSVCGAPLYNWANGSYVDVFSSFGSWCYSKKFRTKKYVAFLEGSEVSAGWNSRNLILTID